MYRLSVALLFWIQNCNSESIHVSLVLRGLKVLSEASSSIAICRLLFIESRAESILKEGMSNADQSQPIRKPEIDSGVILLNCRKVKST